MSRNGRRTGRPMPRPALPVSAGGHSNGHSANGHTHTGQPAGHGAAQAPNGSWGRPSSRRYTGGQQRSQG